MVRRQKRRRVRIVKETTSGERNIYWFSLPPLYYYFTYLENYIMCEHARIITVFQVPSITVFMYQKVHLLMLPYSHQSELNDKSLQ